MRRSVLLAVALALVTTPVFAQPLLWLCETTENEPGSVIAPEIAVLYEPGKSTATVSDGLIIHVVKEPVQAKAARNGDKLALNWQVKRIPARHNRFFTARFNMTLDTRTLKMAITAIPQGADNRFDATGTCKVQKRR